MIRAVLLIGVVVACTSDLERASQAAEARQARNSLLTTEVVQSLKTPPASGRLIYERPADLSYDSLQTTRPDLLLGRDRRKP